MKKKIIPYTVVVISFILCLTLPAGAAELGAPQDMDGLQVANIVYYLGDSFTFYEPTFTADMIVPTTAYTRGLDLAELVSSIDTGFNTKIRFTFTWLASDQMSFNALCIKNIPSDFRITVSAGGISSMTGSSYSQAFNYVDQQDGWYRFDSFSSSATQTPVFSQILSLDITIDGGSAHLSTLADDSIVLSLSMLPYNLNAASDLQYNLGYQDAQKVYKEILQQEKQNSFDSGVLKGYSDGLDHAQNVLIPEAEDLARAEGYAEGKADGLSTAENGDLRNLIFSIPEAHLVALEGFTNWNLFGYNLYDILGGIVVLVILAVIVKVGLKFVL